MSLKFSQEHVHIIRPPSSTHEERLTFVKEDNGVVDLGFSEYQLDDLTYRPYVTHIQTELV
jgi:hypothetical protein